MRAGKPRPGMVPCPNGCGGMVVEGAYIDPSLPCPPRPKPRAR